MVWNALNRKYASQAHKHEYLCENRFLHRFILSFISFSFFFSFVFGREIRFKNFRTKLVCKSTKGALDISTVEKVLENLLFKCLECSVNCIACMNVKVFQLSFRFLFLFFILLEASKWTHETIPFFKRHIVGIFYIFWTVWK